MGDKSSLKLDEEFKKCLLVIRALIMNLTNPHDITCCRVWMEKIYNSPVQDKSIRNEYLHELCRQIKNDKIEEPFTSPPPEGPLVEMETGLLYSSASWSDISTESTTTMEVPGSGDSNHDHTQTDNLNIYSYECKIKEQQEITAELTQKNECLSANLNQYTDQLNKRNTKAEIGINMLADEVNFLKARLKELVNMKKDLQTSHNSIVTQWEMNTHKLESNLKTEQHKNSELLSVISQLERKLKVAEVIQNTDSNFLQKELLDKHHEEINTLHEKHSEFIKRLEAEHATAIKNINTEYENKIQELTSTYEQRIEEICSEADKNAKYKDEEIIRLGKLVDVQCDRMQQDVVYIKSQMDQDCCINKDTLVEKVSFLQKCILKMEKLLRKYEKHYTKKITVLNRELLMKDNSLQIQLTTQRAQLLSRASSERQMEIEEIVSQLECRYRALLEEQQSQATAVRQQHVDMIKQLTDKLGVNTNSTNSV